MLEHGRSPAAWIPLGTLGRPRGLAGAMWFHPHNEASEALGPGVSVRVVPVGGSARTLRIVDLVESGGGLVIRLDGVIDRDGAVALTRAVVELQRKDFPPLAPGEYYHVDLEGLPVVDTAGRAVGTVLRVEAYPTVDALVIKTETGTLELPVTDAVVPAIDVAAGRITVDPGALDDGTA